MHLYYREASCVPIPFDHASSTESVDDSDLIFAQKQAGPAVRLFIKLGRLYEEGSSDRAVIDREVREFFASNNNMKVDSRIVRIYTLLLFFTVKVRLLFDINLFYFIFTAFRDVRPP